MIITNPKKLEKQNQRKERNDRKPEQKAVSRGGKGLSRPSGKGFSERRSAKSPSRGRNGGFRG